MREMEWKRSVRKRLDFNRLGVLVSYLLSRLVGYICEVIQVVSVKTERLTRSVAY